MVSRGLACVDCLLKCDRSHAALGGFLPVYRFFKIMFGNNCSHFLYLPPGSAKLMKHLTNQETQIEDVSGQRWSVKMSLVNGSLAFERGWEKFFVDHGLKVGEVMTFQYIEGGHFTVKIFGTSGRERTNFDRRSKKRRRDHGIASEDESFLASRDESRNCKMKIEVENAGLGVSTLVPIPEDIVDPICMINKNDWYHAEHRISLCDLSFEMENRTSEANKCEGGVITMLDPLAETEEHGAYLDNAPSPKVSISCDRILELTNTVEGDEVEKTKTTAEEVVVIKRDIADESRKKMDDTQMAPQSHQEVSHSGHALTNKFHEKLSDNSEMKKGILDNVCSFQDVIPVAVDELESISVYPSVGSSKIVKREVKSSSSTVKDPLGLHAAKKEVNMEDQAKRIHQGSCGGEEPSAMWNQPQMIIPPIVKVEPDLPYETGQLDTTNPISICPFSTQIESQPYLEVSVKIVLAHTRRWRLRLTKSQKMKAPMIIYLRGSVGGLWPVVYREYVGGGALTANWTEFCKRNSIKPRDNCRFQAEENISFVVFRVIVTHGSD
ncbi:hypothetical protein SASPL_117845 [Salvia splendens]|uniref:TF-B3 domain-containing protein n=1 Tax=Salvia splendens TaxID=180675 RepID=A0A8X8Y091_SALSN|nr:uncharacterized protein LOC121807818 isoform X2 [Salvia splendens]KAG6421295.1 hypothetical protein SASPL_117845 [Salvia splendens]